MPRSRASTSPPACSPSPPPRAPTTGSSRATSPRRLPFEDARFAGCVCAGVFTTGHVGAEGLDELLRVIRPGGVLVLTVKDKTWDGGFAARVAALEAEGRVARLDATPSYSSMPGRPGNDPSRASSSAASDRGKIVDAPTAHGEPSSPGGREDPTMIRRILATTALAGALAAARPRPRRTRRTRSG